MDILPKIQEQTIFETAVRFSMYLKTRFKIWIDCLKSHAKKVLKERLDFPFESKIETIDTLPKILGQTIDETTVRFSI